MNKEDVVLHILNVVRQCTGFDVPPMDLYEKREVVLHILSVVRQRKGFDVARIPILGKEDKVVGHDDKVEDVMRAIGLSLPFAGHGGW